MKIKGCKLRGEVWYSNLVIPGSGGKIHCQALSADPGEAKRLCAEIKADLMARDPKKLALCKSADMPIDIFAEKVLLRYQKKMPGTYRIVARALRKLMEVESLNVRTVGDVTPDTLEALRDHWIKIGHIKVDASGSPIGTENLAGSNREIRALVTVMRWAEDDKEIRLTPQNWRTVIKSQFNVAKGRKLFYTPAQHKELKKAAGTGLMLTLYMLAYHAGLRRAEIRHLRREDVDLENRRLHIRAKTWTNPRTGKPEYWAPKGTSVHGDMERTVPLDNELFEYMTALIAKLPGDWIMSEDLAIPVHEDTLSDMWYDAVQASGVKAGSIHTLRHCFATDWLSRGEPLENVQKFLGHASIELTNAIYNHFVPKKFATMGVQ